MLSRCTLIVYRIFEHTHFIFLDTVGRSVEWFDANKYIHIEKNIYIQLNRLDNKRCAQMRETTCKLNAIRVFFFFSSNDYYNLHESPAIR